MRESRCSFSNSYVVPLAGLGRQYLNVTSWVYQVLSTRVHPLATLKLGEDMHPLAY